MTVVQQCIQNLVDHTEELVLMLWALTHDWSLSKRSLYDEEGIEGWEWSDPRGVSYCCVGSWDGPPEIDDKIKSVMQEQFNARKW